MAYVGNIIIYGPNDYEKYYNTGKTTGHLWIDGRDKTHLI